MYPHPKYLDRGASPIQAQAYNVDIEHYIEVYERDFFAFFGKNYKKGAAEHDSNKKSENRKMGLRFLV